ncbi:IclR family transcriptional regulator [Shimia sp.]|uniref:IclR family transcriptional regulator n=1 Tax=Shimia sp. TaxID=1954381 RepID=UPI0032971FFF
MTEDAPKTPKVDSTLSKGLSILENLAHSQKGKGVTELSVELGLTKSNTFRLLQSLTTLGYVKHLDNKAYAATLKMWQTGRASVDNLNLRELASSEMSFLSRETGETIYLAVPENLGIIYIDKIESQKPIRSWSPIGGNVPIHCVGTGKAILSANYGKLRERVKTQLTRHTDKTLTSITALDKDMDETIARGYAVDRGEFRERIWSLGAAITLPNGEAIASLGVSLPDVSMPDGGVEKYGALVANCAESVSEKLARR